MELNYFLSSLLFLTLNIFFITYVHGEKSTTTMPAPFYRELYANTPYFTGNDVKIAQTLLARDDAVGSSIPTTGTYDDKSAEATKAFQAAHGLTSTGVFDAVTAQLVLDLHSADNYHDSGFTAASMGYKYKFHIPVHKNRSIETMATLFDANNLVLLNFRVRTHGHRDDGSAAAWPDYGVNDVGYNEFSSDGNSITGLLQVDLNSPEPNPDMYGPWPVNRFVRGLEGNAQLMLPNIRDGILLHTGNWTTSTHQWNPLEDMPNSSGCVHAHPQDVERIYKLLTGLGVVVNDNPFSGKNYPYEPQGIAVIELIDEAKQ